MVTDHVKDQSVPLLPEPTTPTAPTEPAAPLRVTAVCLGNICRSPIAEAVLRDRIDRAGLSHLVSVDSAGTGDWHLGYPTDPRSQAILTLNGYELTQTARQITSSWMAELDIILVMDGSNYTNVEALIHESGHEPELYMMRSFDPELSHLDEVHPDLDVPDPYFNKDEGFALVLDMIERAADAFVAGLPARLNQ
jgi:protein-tyrosine phosphatase